MTNKTKLRYAEAQVASLREDLAWAQTQIADQEFLINAYKAEMEIRVAPEEIPLMVEELALVKNQNALLLVENSTLMDLYAEADAQKDQLTLALMEIHRTALSLKQDLEPFDQDGI
jgi:hypothetical protein